MGNLLNMDLPPVNESGESSASSLMLALTTETKGDLSSLPEDINKPLMQKLYSKKIFWTWAQFVNSSTQNTHSAYDSDDACKKEMKKLAKTLSFIQDIDGTPISKAKANIICTDLRRLFKGVRDDAESKGKPWPRSFTQFNMEQRESVECQIYSLHPILRLCEDHYKFNKTVIQIYPGWKKEQKLKNKEAEAKKEEEEKKKKEEEEEEKKKKQKRDDKKKRKAQEMEESEGRTHKKPNMADTDAQETDEDTSSTNVSAENE